MSTEPTNEELAKSYVNQIEQAQERRQEKNQERLERHGEAAAIVITTIIGVTAGIIMTRHNKLASFLMLTTNFIYTIPSIALFGFLVAISQIFRIIS